MHITLYPENNLLKGILVLAIGLLLVSCAPPSVPEKKFSQLKEALKAKNYQQVWSLLSKKSQEELERMIKHQGFKKPVKKIFFQGVTSSNWTLRKNPKKPHIVKEKSARLQFLNELEQSVEIISVKESNQWKFSLGKYFAKSTPHINQNDLSSLPRSPSCLK